MPRPARARRVDATASAAADVELVHTPAIDPVRIDRVAAILRNIMDSAERKREGRRS